MNRIAAIAALLLLATASPARAQPTGEAPRGKSEDTATLLSVLGTVTPLAVTTVGVLGNQDELAVAGAVGMLVGPSLGQWYAGRYVTGGLALRGGGAALMVVGVGRLVQSFHCEEGEDCPDGGGTLMLAGAVAFISGTMYDIATAGSAARRWNAKHLDLGPTVVRGASGPVPGFGIAGSF